LSEGNLEPAGELLRSLKYRKIQAIEIGVISGLAEVEKAPLYGGTGETITRVVLSFRSTVRFSWRAISEGTELSRSTTVAKISTV
jgi:hypothetical protein